MYTALVLYLYSITIRATFLPIPDFLPTFVCPQSAAPCQPANLTSSQLRTLLHYVTKCFSKKAGTLHVCVANATWLFICLGQMCPKSKPRFTFVGCVAASLPPFPSRALDDTKAKALKAHLQ